ncbi:MAG: glycerol-3-phosphate dehydrogenase, partial [Hyphomicrobium denitrificans]|nr:glycerol-3-phosphate dehydrogenase [Hyphomicrobium denitrificans]
SDNVSAITRDYRLDLQSGGTPPILTVIGGKITTYRRLAEAALDLLAQHLPAARSGSTKTAPLPGGDFEGRTFDAWFDDFARRHAGFERRTLMRLAHRYGTRTARVIDGATSERDLGQDFGAGLCAREIAYLRSEEWADAAEDILWRRTKTGLHIAPEARASAADAIQGYVDKL